MSSNITPAKNGSAVIRRCLLSLGRSSIGGGLSNMQRRAWTVSGAAPSVSTSSRTSSPVVKGDFVFRSDNKAVYVCSAAPTANTNASFVQIV